VVWLASLESAFLRAIGPLSIAENEFYEKRGRVPQTVRDFIAAGVDSARLATGKDNPRLIIFQSPERVPSWPGLSPDSLRVTRSQDEEGTHYAAFVLFIGETLWCRLSVTASSSLHPRCATF